MMTASGHEVVVLLGSNSTDAPRQMEQAYRWLEECMTITAASTVYSSAPFEGTGSEYLNRVVKGVYGGASGEFEASAKRQEMLQGRDRASRTVTIDIDLITYGNTSVRPDDMRREYFLKGLRLLKKI